MPTATRVLSTAPSPVRIGLATATLAAFFSLLSSPARAQGSEVRKIIDKTQQSESLEQHECRWWDVPSTLTGGAFLLPIGRARGFVANMPGKTGVFYDTAILETQLRWWASYDPDDWYRFFGFQAGAGLISGLTGDRLYDPEVGYFFNGEVMLRAGSMCGSRYQVAAGTELTYYLPTLAAAPDELVERYVALRWAPSASLRLSVEHRWVKTVGFLPMLSANGEAEGDGDSSVTDPNTELSARMIGGEVDFRFLDREDFGVHFVASYHESYETSEEIDSMRRWQVAVRYRQDLKANTRGMLGQINRTEQYRRLPSTVRVTVGGAGSVHTLRSSDSSERVTMFGVGPDVEVTYWPMDVLALAVRGSFFLNEERPSLFLVAPSIVLHRTPEEPFSAWWLRLGFEMLAVRSLPESPPADPLKNETVQRREIEPFLHVWVRPNRYFEVGVHGHILNGETWRWGNEPESGTAGDTPYRWYRPNKTVSSVAVGPALRLTIPFNKPKPSGVAGFFVLHGQYLAGIAQITGGREARRWSFGGAIRIDVGAAEPIVYDEEDAF